MIEKNPLPKKKRKRFKRKTLWCEEKRRDKDSLKPHTPPKKRREGEERLVSPPVKRPGRALFLIPSKEKKKGGKTKASFPQNPKLQLRKGEREERPFTLLNEQQQRQHQQRKQHSSSSR